MAVVSFPLTAVFIPRALGHRRIVKVAKTLRSLGDHLQVGTSVRNVYGDPVNVGGRTVIPIARVSYGFGAGGSEEVKSERGGSGGGAGMSARPVGALEITEAGTRFIPFIDPTRLGMALVVGFLIGLTIGHVPPCLPGSRFRQRLPALVWKIRLLHGAQTRLVQNAVIAGDAPRTLSRLGTERIQGQCAALLKITQEVPVCLQACHGGQRGEPGRGGPGILLRL